jgi:hypothetical protein
LTAEQPLALIPVDLHQLPQRHRIQVPGRTTVRYSEGGRGSERGGGERWELLLLLRRAVVVGLRKQMSSIP